MTLAGLGALVGLLFGAGLLLVVSAFRADRPTLMSRVLPFVPEVAWYLQHDTVTLGVPSRRRRPSRSIRGDDGPADVWAEQLLWGGVSLTLVVAVWFLQGGDVLARPGQLVVVALLALVAGVVARQVVVLLRERGAVEGARRELPVVAETLSTSVGAGIDLEQALRRCAADLPGPLAARLGEVLRVVDDGVPLPRALEGLGEASPQEEVAEFLFGMAVALDRGTPLADVLAAQTLDVRAARARDLIRTERRRAPWVLAAALIVGAAMVGLVLLWSGAAPWPEAPGWLSR